MDTQIRILVSLPSSYPGSSPPQLQLLSRYIGPFSVDAQLFGSVLKTFISKDGVEWLSDSICVFDGVENVRERCASWFAERLNEERANGLLRDEMRDGPVQLGSRSGRSVTSDVQGVHGQQQQHLTIPDGIEFAVAEAITDRKSAFVGRACRIEDPSQVRWN